MKPIYFFLFALLLFNIQSYAQQTLPCYGNNLPSMFTDSPAPLGADFNPGIGMCNGQDAVLFRHLPDGHLIPGCGTDNVGTLQFDLGIWLENPFAGFTVCLELGPNQVLLAESQLTNIMTTPIFAADSVTLVSNLVCGDISYAGYALNQDYCNSIWMKYDAFPGLFGSWTKNTGIKIFPIGSDPLNTTPCHEDYICTACYLIGGTPSGQAREFFTFSQGNASITELPLQSSFKFLIVPPNTTLTQDYPPGFEAGNLSFIFGANSSFVIPNNRSLLLTNCMISGCTDWQGIDAIGGSTIDIHDSEIQDAQIALETGIETDLIFNDNYIHNNGVGVKINGAQSPGSTPFENNLFENLNTGVVITNVQGSISNALSASSTTSNTFEDCEDGVFITNAQSDIRHNIFKNSTRGIRLLFSNYNDFRDNDFTDIDIGIIGVFSSLNASFNTMQGVTTGIQATKVNNSDFIHNTIIAKRYGIRMLASNAIQIRNENEINIDVNAPGNQYAGIRSDMSTASIQGNFINTSGAHAGISLSTTNNMVIENNAIDADGIGIWSTASKNSIIKENIIDGYSGGIGLLNSPNNLLECNAITSSFHAIQFGSNSNSQTIATNDIYSGILRTRCILGVQVHTGNKFYSTNSTAYADNLSNLDVINSRFVVDAQSPLFINPDYNPMDIQSRPLLGLPNFWNPASFFDPMVDQGNETLSCNSPQGPGVVGEDPCYLTESLGNDKQSNYDRYFINSMHLFVQQLIQNEFTIWEPCFQNFWNAETNDDLKDLAILIKDLTVILSESDVTLENGYQSLKYALDYGSDVESHLININNLQQTKNQNFLNLISSQKLEVAAFSSGSTLEGIWQDTYQALIRFLAEEVLDQNTLSELINIAAACPDDIGDPVHWARSILQAINYNPMPELSDCTTGELSRKQLISSNADFQINPNPSFGTITLERLPALTIQIDILNGSGIYLQTLKIEEPSQKIMEIDGAPGVYFAKVTLSNGDIQVKKFVIL